MFEGLTSSASHWKHAPPRPNKSEGSWEAGGRSFLGKVPGVRSGGGILRSETTSSVASSCVDRTEGEEGGGGNRAGG